MVDLCCSIALFNVISLLYPFYFPISIWDEYYFLLFFILSYGILDCLCKSENYSLSTYCGKFKVVNFLYIFDQCQESYLLTDIALLSCEDYIYLLTPQSYSSWVIDGESQCSLDFPNCQSVAQFPHLPEGKNNHI